MRILGAKRKEVLALSSICDAKVVQKRPAASRYGQNHLFRRRKTLTCGRTASVVLLELDDFDSYLNEIPKGYRSLGGLIYAFFMRLGLFRAKKV